MPPAGTPAACLRFNKRLFLTIDSITENHLSVNEIALQQAGLLHEDFMRHPVRDRGKTQRTAWQKITRANTTDSLSEKHTT
jgi:hypothetical protein